MFQWFAVMFLTLAGFAVKWLTNWLHMVEKHCGWDETCGLTAEYSDVYIGLSVGLWIVAAIWLVATVVNLISEVYGQRSDQEEIKKLVAQRSLAHQRWVTIKGLMIKYLAETYPEYEKAILAKLAEVSSDNLNAVATNYPELNASETFTALCDHLQSLYDTVYNKDVKIQETLQQMRMRRRNPWVPMKFLIPREPEVQPFTIQD
ncbi:TPA: hypothetical protein DF272_06580 [Candidatus Falkowbacteria bacterium]|nr:hypothetical protein [Candidatus Falkowbacteria bacterium]